MNSKNAIQISLIHLFENLTISQEQQKQIKAGDGIITEDVIDQ